MSKPRFRNPEDDPKFQAWAEHVKVNVLPLVRDASMTVSLVPDEATKTDIKFAVELGLSIMMDKPIIAVVAPGMKVPDHLVRVADHIVEWRPGMSNDQLMAALDAVMNEKGTNGDEDHAAPGDAPVDEAASEG